jgi:hypothetical protein
MSTFFTSARDQSGADSFFEPFSCVCDKMHAILSIRGLSRVAGSRLIEVSESEIVQIDVEPFYHFIQGCRLDP